ncbi:MAG: GIY-YIG nuclease family protein [Anaerolineae bacterium]|nr:GIY-YIG nuclease family protein [Anaerolineae bacterium]
MATHSMDPHFIRPNPDLAPELRLPDFVHLDGVTEYEARDNSSIVFFKISADLSGYYDVLVCTHDYKGVFAIGPIAGSRIPYALYKNHLLVEGAIWKIASSFSVERTSTSVVYFIQSSTGGLIKIGTAINANRRLAEIQNMSPVPLRILAVIPGDCRKEAELHKRFAHLRRHGEWFEPTIELLDFIRQAEDK